MRRIRVRTLMILVGVVGVLLGSIGPGRAWYRRWTWHWSQAAVYGRIEARERIRAEREKKRAFNREAITSAWMRSPEFAAKSPDERERIIETRVKYHRLESEQASTAASQWEEKRRTEETAALWCWDPYAPDVP